MHETPTVVTEDKKEFLYSEANKLMEKKAQTSVMMALS